MPGIRTLDPISDVKRTIEQENKLVEAKIPDGEKTGLPIRKKASAPGEETTPNEGRKGLLMWQGILMRKKPLDEEKTPDEGKDC